MQERGGGGGGGGPQGDFSVNRDFARWPGAGRAGAVPTAFQPTSTQVRNCASLLHGWARKENQSFLFSFHSQQ